MIRDIVRKYRRVGTKHELTLAKFAERLNNTLILPGRQYIRGKQGLPSPDIGR
jgi:hypothetical protein